MALAARATFPWAAVLGATIGSLAVIAPAAILGEAGWRALPLKPLRLGIGVCFLVAGFGLGLGALGLI